MTTSTGTREQILDAAWRMFNRSRHGLPTVAQIAVEAGVSRQAIYLHFGNRATLLVETTRRQDARSGFSERIRSTRDLEPRAALVAYITEWFAYIPEVMTVARALMAAEAAGEDGGEAWRDRMSALRASVRFAIDRIAQAGLLADGWTDDTAADWVWSHIHFTTWYHLAVECGWDRDALLDHTVRTVLAEVCRE